MCVGLMCWTICTINQSPGGCYCDKRACLGLLGTPKWATEAGMPVMLHATRAGHCSQEPPYDRVTLAPLLLLCNRKRTGPCNPQKASGARQREEGVCEGCLMSLHSCTSSMPNPKDSRGGGCETRPSKQHDPSPSDLNNVANAQQSRPMHVL